MIKNNEFINLMNSKDEFINNQCKMSTKMAEETIEKCSKCKSLFVEPNVIELAKQFVTSIDSIEKLLFLLFLGKIMT